MTNISGLSGVLSKLVKEDRATSNGARDVRGGGVSKTNQSGPLLPDNFMVTTNKEANSAKYQPPKVPTASFDKGKVGQSAINGLVDDVFNAVLSDKSEQAIAKQLTAEILTAATGPQNQVYSNIHAALTSFFASQCLSKMTDVELMDVIGTQKTSLVSLLTDYTVKLVNAKTTAMDITRKQNFNAIRNSLLEAQKNIVDQTDSNLVQGVLWGSRVGAIIGAVVLVIAVVACLVTAPIMGPIGFIGLACLTATLTATSMQTSNLMDAGKQIKNIDIQSMADDELSSVINQFSCIMKEMAKNNEVADEILKWVNIISMATIVFSAGTSVISAVAKAASEGVKQAVMEVLKQAMLLLFTGQIGMLRQFSQSNKPSQTEDSSVNEQSGIKYGFDKFSEEWKHSVADGIINTINIQFLVQALLETLFVQVADSDEGRKQAAFAAQILGGVLAGVIMVKGTKLLNGEQTKTDKQTLQQQLFFLQSYFNVVKGANAVTKSFLGHKTNIYDAEIDKINEQKQNLLQALKSLLANINEHNDENIEASNKRTAEMRDSAINLVAGTSEDLSEFFHIFLKMLRSLAIMKNGLLAE